MTKAQKTGTVKDVFDALKAQGKELIKSKGGFHVKGEGFLSLSKARKLTGIKAPERQFRGKQKAGGDWAWVEAINSPAKRQVTILTPKAEVPVKSVSEEK